jgi:preprotein translocase subunit SecE
LFVFFNFTLGVRPHMAQNDVQVVSSAKDKILLVLSFVFLFGAAVAYQALAGHSFFLRLGVLLVTIIFAIVVFCLSSYGRRFFGFAVDSFYEVKRVDWPSRSETVRLTLVVFGFVAIVALYLLLVDKTLEWLVYDLILGWAR